MTISECSVGLMHKVAKAWVKAGGTTAQLNSLAEDETAMWNLVASRRAASVGDQPPVEPRIFPVSKTIQIGGKTGDKLLAELEAAGFKVSDSAKDMMSKSAFTTEVELREIDLVEVIVGDLGFLTGADTPQSIWNRAKELGLALCPPSVGPHLRLAYRNQLSCESLWIAMEQIVGSDGFPYVFNVGRDAREYWLREDVAQPPGGWHAARRIAFVRPRKSA